MALLYNKFVLDPIHLFISIYYKFKHESVTKYVAHYSIFLLTFTKNILFCFG